ncbi:hypothetical protein Tco_1348221 [Tanacetum coccineum]
MPPPASTAGHHHTAAGNLFRPTPKTSSISGSPRSTSSLPATRRPSPPATTPPLPHHGSPTHHPLATIHHPHHLHPIITTPHAITATAAAASPWQPPCITTDTITSTISSPAPHHSTMTPHRSLHYLVTLTTTTETTIVATAKPPPPHTLPQTTIMGAFGCYKNH